MTFAHHRVMNELQATIQIIGEGVPAIVALPERTTPATPSIVMPMHLYGLDRAMREAAQRFARHGFLVVVPDLYRRFDAPQRDDDEDPRPFLPFAQRLQPVEVDADLRAAATWLRTRLPDTKIGLAGFCMGGAMALRRANNRSEAFRAAAMWYGSVDGVAPEDVDIPLIGSFGEDDVHLPNADVVAFFDRVPVAHNLVVYREAGHAFCDETRSSYCREPAEDSWRRTTAFLHAHLT
jgi:carboxymethylenebutenolidase